jgi:hypothetical protein
MMPAWSESGRLLLTLMQRQLAAKPWRKLRKPTMKQSHLAVQRWIDKKQTLRLRTRHF